MAAPEARRSSASSDEGSLARGKSTYSTFSNMPVQESLFEVHTFMQRVQSWMWWSLWVSLGAALVWPVGWLLGFAAAIVGFHNKQRAWQMGAVYLLLAAALGVLLFGPALLLVGIGGGPAQFVAHLKDMNISIIDVIGFWFAEVIVLLFIVFSVLNYEVTMNVNRFKVDVIRKLSSMRDGYVVCIQEEKVIENLINKKICKREDVKNNEVRVRHIIALLNTLPGYEPLEDAIDQADDVKRTASEQDVFMDLRKYSDEASLHGVSEVEVFSLRRLERDDLGANSLLQMLRFRFHIVYKIASENAYFVMAQLNAKRGPLYTVLLLAVLRALIPRAWVGIYFGKPFLPQHLAPLLLAIYSFMTMSATSFMWIGLFQVFADQYKVNIIQATIISALVDPTMRTRYASKVLAGRLEKEEAAAGFQNQESSRPHYEHGEAWAALQALPVLSLREPKNIASFWRIREFGRLDRTNERASIRLLIDMLTIWLVLNMLVALVDLFGGGRLTAFVPVMLFDLVVFGHLVVRSLRHALELNGIASQHKNLFVQAKYECIMAAERLRARNDSSSDAALGSPSPRTRPSESPERLRQACELLGIYGEMITHNDHREKIFLGMDVTIHGILGATLTVGMACFTIISKMYALGVMSQSAQHAKNTVAGAAARLVASRATEEAGKAVSAFLAWH